MGDLVNSGSNLCDVINEWPPKSESNLNLQLNLNKQDWSRKVSWIDQGTVEI